MKAAYLTALRSFAIRQTPDPVLVRDTDVLVRIQRVGVCGSDIHYYTAGKIGSQVAQFPFVVGHEASGVVERMGKSVRRVRPGDRIAIDPAISCGTCDQCRSGREHTCRTLQFMGAPGQRDGCLSEFVVADEKCCYAIPESMTFDQAALCEPLSIALYTVEKSSHPPKADVAILGMGPIGMCVFHALRAGDMGNVFVTDRIDERLGLSRPLRPAWCGNPDRQNVVEEIARIEPLLLDVVYECSGDEAAIRQGIELLKPGGKLVLVGIPGAECVSFPIHDMRRKEITLVNIRRQVHCTQPAIDVLATGGIDLNSLITHRFPLEATGEAFGLVARHGDGVMKAMIELG
jgi:L-iditol 2-dehydrogenase